MWEKITKRSSPIHYVEYHSRPGVIYTGNKYLLLTLASIKRMHGPRTVAIYRAGHGSTMLGFKPDASRDAFKLDRGNRLQSSILYNYHSKIDKLKEHRFYPGTFTEDGILAIDLRLFEVIRGAPDPDC